MTIADLQPPAVPDAENAAIDLQAAGSIVRAAPKDEWDSLSLILPWTPEEEAHAKATLARYQPALDRLRAARGKSGVDWKIQLSSPLIKVLLPDLPDMRSLANLTAASILAAHVRGDDVQAIERIDDLLFLSKAVDKMPGIMVAHLVADAIRALACHKLLLITSDLLVDSSAVGNRPVTHERVRALMLQLLDDQPQREGQRWAMMQERILDVDSVECILSGKFPASQVGSGTRDSQSAIEMFFSRPALLNDARLGAQYVTETVAAAQSADWPSAQGRRSRIFDDLDRYPERHSPIAAVVAPSYSKGMLVDFKVRTQMRACAIGLALRLYAIDHDGKLPAKLEELAPKYLAAIPGDPMAAGSPPFHYIPDATDPRIYSVGANGKDDGGSDALENNKHSYGETLDMVFHYRLPPRELNTNE